MNAEHAGTRPEPAVPGALLGVQLAWVASAMAWNLAGLWLIAHGGRPLGPTASAATVVALLLVGSLMAWGRTRKPMLYAGLCALCGLLAAASVLNALTAVHTLWPSEFWRLAGAALNMVGSVSSLVAVFCVAKGRAVRHGARTD